LYKENFTIEEDELRGKLIVNINSVCFTQRLGLKLGTKCEVRVTLTVGTLINSGDLEPLKKSITI
jgi:hypothetical protein